MNGGFSQCGSWAKQVGLAILKRMASLTSTNYSVDVKAEISLLFVSDGSLISQEGVPPSLYSTPSKSYQNQKLSRCACPHSCLLTGKVVEITDGDTLYVLDANSQQHKIRLAGIDALERKQAYGLASRKHLVSIVAAKQVTIEYQKRDRYGRIVGKIFFA